MDRTLERMLQKLSLPIRRQLQAVPASCWEQVQEIRLQQGREPYLVVAGRPMRLGQLLHRPISTEPVQPQQLQESFAALCDYSVHTCLPQLLEGYLTVEGGHRIGIGATAVIQNGRLCSVRQVSSLNLRIAHCIAHPASLSIEPLAEQLFSRGLCSVLVAGEPGSGKTTLLRALSRWLSGRWKVTIVDERGELYEPNFSAQDGLCCMDFLRGFPKAQGVLQAVRTLSPGDCLRRAGRLRGGAAAVVCAQYRCLSAGFHPRGQPRTALPPPAVFAVAGKRQLGPGAAAARRLPPRSGTGDMGDSPLRFITLGVSFTSLVLSQQ